MVELTSSLSDVGAKRGILCILGFPGVANPNNSTRKICFKETISHDSIWNAHDWNFDLDISLAWSVRGCLYNVLLWHMFSDSLLHVYCHGMNRLEQCFSVHDLSLHWMCPRPHAFFSVSYSLISSLNRCRIDRLSRSCLTWVLMSIKFWAAANNRMYSWISGGNQSQ